MDDSLKDKWAVFISYYRNFSCPFCDHQGLDFDEPKQDKIAGNDVIAVTCLECGHIELFDANQVVKAAERIKKRRSQRLF